MNAILSLLIDMIVEPIAFVSFSSVVHEARENFKVLGWCSKHRYEASGIRRKFPRGVKVSSQSCDVTNKLNGECQRYSHSRVVQRHDLGKFCKITCKNTHFRAFWKQVLV